MGSTSATSVARAENTGRGFGTGCILTMWGGTTSTVCWPCCGAGCSGTPISLRSTAPTTAGTASCPACWPLPSCSSSTTRSATPRPRLVPTSISAGDWPWGLRWRRDRLPRAYCRCSRPADPAQQGAPSVRAQPTAGPGVGLPEKAEHEFTETSCRPPVHGKPGACRG